MNAAAKSLPQTYSNKDSVTTVSIAIDFDEN
jgi:hypothetical protein